MFDINRLFLYGLIVTAAFMSGYGIAWKNGRDNLNAYVMQQKALAEAQDKINQEKAQRDEKAISDVKTNYDRSLANLHSYYKRLHDSSTSANNLPAKSKSPSGTNGSTSDSIPDPSELASQCAVTTLMLVNLQEFERRVSE